MNLFHRIRTKVFMQLFWLLRRSKFRFLSRSAVFVGPHRVDGSEGISIGDRSFFQRGVWLYCCGNNSLKANLTVGKNCVFGYNNHITCVRDVVIGDYVLTANNVYISDNLHGYEDIDLPIMMQPVLYKNSVEIGSGAWIGENVCIIGASVGKNSVIGANSVVTKNIPDFCVAVGAPAAVIRRFDVQLRKWVDVK